MVVLAIIVGSLTASMMFVLALRQFLGLLASRRRAVGAAEFARGEREFSLLREFDERLQRTRLGGWLVRELDLAGLSHRPIHVLGVGVAAGAVGTWVLWRFVSTVFAVLGIALAAVLVRRYLSRAKARRREKFIAQLPEPWPTRATPGSRWRRLSGSPAPSCPSRRAASSPGSPPG